MVAFEQLQADFRRFHEVEAALADEAIAADPARVQTLNRERGQLAKRALAYGRYLDLGRHADEAETLAAAEPDPEMRAYAEAEAEALRDRERQAGDALRDLLYDEAAGLDRAGLILEFRAGTGGDEAALFARDLFEMYRRFGERMGWEVEPLEMLPTELGGFREATLGIRGPGAYRHLQFESGGHRVQRVPETETQGRIHTSAATVAVLPEPEDVEVAIRAEDLEIDVMRAGGPGGQHQNKTESGVRITHKPSGLVVNCRDERSQHKNKAKALRILKSRLFEAEAGRIHNERSEQRRSLIGSGDRSQRIRTYNFPQNRLTDHRIGLTIYHLDRVVAGELELVTAPLIDHDRRESLGGF